MIRPATPEMIDRVIGILELYSTFRRIDARASLRDDLALDWLDRIGIACDIAAIFEIDLPDGEVNDWDTVEDVARSIEQRLPALS